MTFLAVVLSSSTDNSTLNDVEPGLLGFLVVAGMGIILVFLLRSMNKQFRKLGPPPEDDAAGWSDDSESDDDAGGGAPADSAAKDGGATARGAKRG